MKLENAKVYHCPACALPLKLEHTKVSGENVLTGEFLCANGHKFLIDNGIPDFTWPKDLAITDDETRRIYEKVADDYEKFALFPFWTFKSDEYDVREKMTDKLGLKENSVVLEIGAGDGRGAEHIVKRLGKNGRFYVQELSPAFLKKSFERLKQYDDVIEYSIANAMYLSFPDKFFDAAFHFGGLNNFSDIKHCLKELVRVVKPGGKIVVGDESMGPWLRETHMWKVMSNSNPLLKHELPLKDIPLEARDVKIEWIMMGAYYLIEFTVGEGIPEAEYHIPIPSERGGSHWTRYYGNLEGVSDEVKKMAHAARKKAGMSMHDWLESVIKKAVKED